MHEHRKQATSQGCATEGVLGVTLADACSGLSVFPCGSACSGPGGFDLLQVLRVGIYKLQLHAVTACKAPQANV